MRMPIVAIVIGIAALIGAGCRTEAVRNVRAPMNAPGDASMADLAQDLTLGGERCGWRVRDAGPGRLRAEKIVGQHRAVSEIAYDQAGYNVTLLQADNLLYDGGQVHKAYNDWVEQLQKCISDEMRFRYQ
jgi:hypothetical protein